LAGSMSHGSGASQLHDDKVFELAQAYVRAVNDLRRIVKEKGAASHEAYEALRVCEAIQRRIKKLQTADRRRNMTVKVLDV